jgi:leader peptidase (prepilin peptidase)/N-methyltransferase
MPEMLAAQPMLCLLLVSALGLVLGSFLNVVIYRLPLMLERAWREDCRNFLESTEQPSEDPAFSLVLPNSFCPHCRHPIRPWHNLPVLGYLLLRGRCADCGKAISIRYPCIELLTAIMSVAIAAKYGFSYQTALALTLSWILIVLSVIDLDRQLLPDTITLPALWLGLLASIGGWFSDPEQSIIGACVGYLTLWSVFHLFKILTGKEGMGFGDFKLLAMLGAWLGWKSIPAIVLLSSSLGVLVGVTMIVLMGRDRRKPIPFGPYLAVAGWICLMWGHELNTAYLRWIDSSM